MQGTLNPPPETQQHDPVTHFVDSENNIFCHVQEDVSHADMVGTTVHDDVNQSDETIGFSFSYRQM